jgi:hypothetical protein
MHHSLKQMLQNTFMGMEMSVWLILGGLLLCFSVFGAFLGIPMIIAGLAFPIMELYNGYRDRNWTGGPAEKDDKPE